MLKSLLLFTNNLDTSVLKPGKVKFLFIIWDFLLAQNVFRRHQKQMEKDLKEDEINSAINVI